MTARSDRRYRFDNLDASGVFLGLGALQLLLFGGGLAFGTVAITAGAPLPVAASGALAGAVGAFGRIGGARVVDWVPVAARWAGVLVRGQRRWFAPLALSDPIRPAGSVPLPACLAGLSLVEAPASWSSRERPGLIHDAQAGTLSAVVRVGGYDFALAARDEQDRLLAGWGDVLAGFATERGAVVRLTWSDHAATGGIAAHRAWLDTRPARSAGLAAASSYRQLLDTTAATSITHTTTVTLTVAEARLRRRSSASGEEGDRLASVLRTGLDALGRALRHAGLIASDPLTPQELSALLRSRCDGGRRAPTCGSLVDRLGGLIGPMSVETAWGHARTDGGVHRAYWVQDWPRLPQPPDWLGPFLAHDPGSPRTFTVVCEPVPPSESRRRIDRETIRLDTDATAREEKGRRVDAHHRRAQMAVGEREAELVAGYAEVAFAGLVTVTAATVDGLETACDDLEATAREHGLELRALDGRHDLGWAAALPFGLGLGRTLP